MRWPTSKLLWRLLVAEQLPDTPGISKFHDHCFGMSCHVERMTHCAVLTDVSRAEVGWGKAGDEALFALT